MQLRGKSFLVTGGGSGIGEAIAKRLLADGAWVVITGRTEEKLWAAQTRLNSERLRILQWDISGVAAFEEKVQAAEKMVGPIDGFVNAAAIGMNAIGRGWAPWDITEAEWNLLSDTNYKAAYVW